MLCEHAAGWLETGVMGVIACARLSGLRLQYSECAAHCAPCILSQQAAAREDKAGMGGKANNSRLSSRHEWRVSHKTGCSRVARTQISRGPRVHSPASSVATNTHSERPLRLQRPPPFPCRPPVRVPCALLLGADLSGLVGDITGRVLAGDAASRHLGRPSHRISRGRALQCRISALASGRVPIRQSAIRRTYKPFLVVTAPS